MAFEVNGCCCMSLRTAGLFHGWIEIVLTIFGIITAFYHKIGNISSQRGQELELELLSYCFDLLIACLLTYGIIKNKRYFILPWLILRSIVLVLAIPTGLFLLSVAGALDTQLFLLSLIYAIICGLLWWSWIVIRSLYGEIREIENRPLEREKHSYENQV